MQIAVPNYKQGNYPGQRLGTQDGATIATFGCAISCIAMIDSKFDPANPWTPDMVDNWFTDHGGYVDGEGHRSPEGGCDLVDWGAINRLLPNSLWQGVDWCLNNPAPIQKVKDHLDSGGLVMLQVGFGGGRFDANGNQVNMHFVVGVGYNGDDIIYNDPYVGDTASFANGRFGSGSASADILAVHYFIDTTPDVPNQPPVASVDVPVQPAPAPAPETPPAASPEPPANEATPPEVTTIPDSGKPATPADDPLPLPEAGTTDPEPQPGSTTGTYSKPPLNHETTINDWENGIMQEFLDFLKGKKSYIVAFITVVYGLLTGHTEAVLQGLSVAGLRAGIGKLGQ